MDTSDKVYIKNQYELDMKVTNTHRHLVKALYNLVSKQPFESITVKDICQEGNVSRSGFYNNFEDKYHLLFFYLRQVDTKLKEKIDFTGERLLLKELLEYVEHHATFFKSLLSLHNGSELHQMLNSAIKEDIENFLWTRATLANQEITPMLDFKAVFLTGGVSSVIQWWVLNDLPLEIDDMTKAINDIVIID